MLDCNLPAAFSPERAGRWFLHSGIQSETGGVARFYRADLKENKPVATEITGYTASALVYLFRATQNSAYLDRALLTAHFLRDYAWDKELAIFPYEHPSPSEVSSHRAFFFDSGIIVRGLIQVGKAAGDDSLLELASQAAHGMLRDFRASPDGYHPILELPAKQPLERSAHWSQSAACYQTKSALAWWEVAEITGDTVLRNAYLEEIDLALRTYREFLPGTDQRIGIMDRLHAYNYFLEAMSPLLDRADCREAYRFVVNSIASHLREIAPQFARSDVYAQLLRARFFGAAALPVNEVAAAEEAAALSVFQISSDDPRLDGGFYFGMRHGEMLPHANPVSTAFALQALDLWRAHRAGENNPCRMPPI